ncbi:pentaheme c-type cytochrome TorC [Cohaesibacter gelatinilyticus]|uniref:Cytochrome c-type protein n=1 Tax=Cohaesibacter gelatinilyticus TaxID=372072 RepID=A0A285PGA6_9HYPH|nr:pentaheme c-type cytochrome TorC [Cohaesibacter gelatinilyticus]SNZ20478.1 trimethylamine-N-oxide reductase (cytochrome c), cytochrome c-type subunit TorC [Cohaesibacter gelatinilyticus]HAT85566.1 pentaheme c-type cytochrome TorC [Hyphomicrobiales bacterium]
MKLWKALWSKTSIYPIGVLLVGAFSFGIIFWGGFNTAMEVTNSLEFCTSCHEMEDNVYQEYKKTVHYSNPSGVRAICSDCHVPKDWFHKTVRKIKASKEVYHKVIGTIDTKEKFESHRLEMAQRVWAEMEANDSRECRNCHSWDAMDFDKQHEKAAKQMKKGMAENQTCISCHKGIAHKLPDMSQGYKRLFEDLVIQAKTDADKSDHLVTLQTKSFYLNEDSAQKQGKTGGKLLAATDVEVLDRNGDLVKIALKGWQQDQVDRVIYALRGQRIFSATLGKQSIDKIKRIKTETDEDTELVWHQVSLEAWVTRDDLLADKKQLWSYADEMYSASCATCHSRPDPGHNLANQWIGILKAMKRFISLDKEQYRFLQKYLQFHAKDTGGAAHHG